jgi:phosphopantothenoylcysteine decarboxylase / phosphopantothenate---cysteine ligase
MLKGKKILIGITGSIAAYKMPLLVRLLVKSGAEVRIVMTPFAREFVTPLTLSTLSGHQVYGDFFDRETGKWHSHVDLGLWADLFLIAPVTANSLAKMRSGIADNYLLTVYLSARCPIMFAPAMDLDMFKHPATQENIMALKQRGHQMIAPTTGELASGLCGEGRMEEPETIFQFLVEFFRKQQTGLMGIEIARAFAIEGAMVDLVIGPTDLQVNHENIRIFPVTTAQEMHDQCIALFQLAQITVMTAAVADYRPKSKAVGKMKKTQESLHIELEPTTDILHEMGSRKKTTRFSSVLHWKLIMNSTMPRKNLNVRIWIWL